MEVYRNKCLLKILLQVTLQTQRGNTEFTDIAVDQIDITEGTCGSGKFTYIKYIT